jgi:hypothetical protein
MAASMVEVTVDVSVDVWVAAMGPMLVAALAEAKALELVEAKADLTVDK